MKTGGNIGSNNLHCPPILSAIFFSAIEPSLNTPCDLLLQLHLALPQGTAGGAVKSSSAKGFMEKVTGLLAMVLAHNASLQRATLEKSSW
jgi:hypothetical protein